MSFIVIFCAAFFSAFSNLIFRINTGGKQANSNSGYLLFFYFSAFVCSLFYFNEIMFLTVNWVVVGLGAVLGILNNILLQLTSRALSRGPAALTFAFHSASAVFTGLFLYVIFGAEFGYTCTAWQLMGMTMVLLGLFIGAKKESARREGKLSWQWLFYAGSCFFVQVLALSLIQGRCVLIDYDHTGSLMSSLSFSMKDDAWFTPGFFGTATLIQLSIFISEKRKPLKREAFYGSLAGVANFGSTCLIMLATRLALPYEKGVLLPCFAVAGLILCNIWSNRLYKERFNLEANAICALGIFLGIAPN